MDQYWGMADVGNQSQYSILTLLQIRSLDHAVELMYHPLASEIPTKRMCLEAIKDLFTYLPQSKANPQDAEVRTKLFLACYSSLFPFLYTGGVGLSHSIGHAIGATYSIPHGITSCLSLAPTVHFKASNPEEAKQIARIVPYIGKQSAGSDEKDSHIVGDAIADLVERLGHKTTLTAVSWAPAILAQATDAIQVRCSYWRRRRRSYRISCTTQQRS
jgi:3-oxoacid CoA-transferase